MRIIASAVLIFLMLELTQAEPRQSKERNHNYILRRQEAGLVSGVPTIRRIIGKREIAYGHRLVKVPVQFLTLAVAAKAKNNQNSFELACVLVRFDHVACFIVDANHSAM